MATTIQDVIDKLDGRIDDYNMEVVELDYAAGAMVIVAGESAERFRLTVEKIE